MEVIEEDVVEEGFGTDFKKRSQDPSKTASRRLSLLESSFREEHDCESKLSLRDLE